MINLFAETTAVLKQHGKTWDDVVWVGTSDFFIPTAEFIKMIADIEYDNSYGNAEVNERLLIVGDTWWLERAEYDGSEWWEFKQQPVRPNCWILPPVEYICQPDYFCRSLSKEKE